MQLQPISTYAHELKPALPREALRPARTRLLWLPVHLAIIALATTAIAAGWVAWPLFVPLALVIGVSFAGLTFLGHETLHGAVVRTRWLQRVVGWIGFLPFVVSPRLWITWHNKVHHGHTALAGVDPDSYPSLEVYRSSRAVRGAVDYFAVGRRKWTGIFSLILGFSGQSGQMLVSGRQQLGMTKGQHREAIGETVLGVLFWAAVASVVGFVPFLFVFGIPLLVANAIVMSFILTNHGLSPRTCVNDPLVNSLSVTVPRWVDVLTLRFGFHVEHHVLPWMSSRYAPRLRELIRARWPERYQSMPLGQALLRLHRTARVYKNATTLIDPHTGEEFATLQPGDQSLQIDVPMHGKSKVPVAAIDSLPSNDLAFRSNFPAIP